jgi:hypothetical protein
MFEFIGRDFPETLEAGDLGILHLGEGALALLVGVTIAGLLFVADPEEGRLQDIKVTFADEVGEELEEEGDREEADVHPVDIGIGREDDLVVTQSVEILLDPECGLEEIELLVLVNDLPRHPVGIERLAAQGEDGLGIDVARLRDRAARRVALGDKEGRLLLELVVRIVVGAAVAELLVVQLRLLRALLGELLDALQFLPLVLGPLDLVEHALGHRLGAVEVVVEMEAEKISDEGPHRLTARGHLGRAELGFGLRLEDGILDPHADRRDDARADVAGLELLLIIIAHRVDDRLAEGGEVGATHGGVLAVDEAVVFLARLLGVGEGHVDVVVGKVDDGVERRFAAGEILLEQVEKAVLRFELRTVERKGQPGVEVGVVPDHRLDELEVPRVMAEDRGIGLEGDDGAGMLVALVRLLHLSHDEALAELDRHGLVLAEGLDLEEGGKEIHRLDPNPVESDGFLERLAVVLRPRVDDGGAVLQLAEGDAAAVVADTNEAFLDLDVDLLAVAHDVLVDGIVDHFLQEDVDPVILRRSITQLADVHPGAKSDVLAWVEGADVLFVVVGGHAGGAV